MSIGFPLTLQENIAKDDIPNIDPIIGYEIKEVPPFGTLIFGAIPITDFIFIVEKFPKGAIVMTGVSNYYKCNTAIAISKELGEQWIEAIEKKLESDYYDPEIRWLHGTDVGKSSKTIYYAMKDGAVNSEGDIPYDPDDFGRCYRLLAKFPEWKTNLKKVFEINPEWKPFIDNWENLSYLYEKEFSSGSAPKLYDKITKLVEESRKIKKEENAN